MTRSTLNVVVFPTVGNEGEDQNWIDWMVVGHEDKTMTESNVIELLVGEFFAENKVDDLYELDDGGNSLFLDFFDKRGYVTFPPGYLQWATNN